MLSNADLWALLEKQNKSRKNLEHTYNSFQWFVGEWGTKAVSFRFLKGGDLDNFKSATSAFNKVTGPFKTRKASVAYIESTGKELYVKF